MSFTYPWLFLHFLLPSIFNKLPTFSQLAPFPRYVLPPYPWPPSISISISYPTGSKSNATSKSFAGSWWSWKYLPLPLIFHSISSTSLQRHLTICLVLQLCIYVLLLYWKTQFISVVLSTMYKPQEELKKILVELVNKSPSNFWVLWADSRILAGILKQLVSIKVALNIQMIKLSYSVYRFTRQK